MSFQPPDFLFGRAFVARRGRIHSYCPLGLDDVAHAFLNRLETSSFGS